MKITAAVAREKGGKLTFEELELEDPREHEVLVRVVACGLCHTDLAILNQYYPTPFPVVLGHEGSGVVEKVGSKVTMVKPGDHVVMSFLTCNECDLCKQGHQTYCPDFYLGNFSGGRMDGSIPLKKGTEVIHGCFFGQSTFATYALATDENIVKVEPSLPLEILGPLGCGIMTGAGAVMNAFRPAAGTSIAVFGIGTVGISAVMAAVICGCTKIIAVDINAERLELVKTFGATHVINSKETDPVQAIRELTGAGVDFSLECIGNPKVTRQAIDCLRTTGVCGLIGAAPMGTEVNVDMNTILFGRALRGIIEGDAIPTVFIPKLIELYKQGRFPIDRLVTFYDFKDINKAIEDLEKGKILKGILRM